MTPDQIRQHVETDLSDEALQRLIDDAEGEIVARFGSLADRTEHLERYDERVFLRVRAEAIVAVVEDGETLDAADYRLDLGGRSIVRLPFGAIWRARQIEVTYTPVADPRRERVLIDLVRLAVEHRGGEMSKAGDMEIRHGNYAAQRDGILRVLGTNVRSYA